MANRFKSRTAVTGRIGETMYRATAEATANIALVKYWGKRDEKLILPKEGSISATMDEQLKTRTTVMFSDKFLKDELILNGKKMEGKDTEERLQQLDVVRKKAGTNLKAKIVSLNCFPTAAGFASSAAGLAALAVAAVAALDLKVDSKELSILSRLGSGSACRSVLGGFVEWKKGCKADGSDSYAVQIAQSSHWPEFRNVIAIVESGKKKVSSRAGMKQTVATSLLYPARLNYLPKLIENVKAAILNKDLPKLLEMVMRDSNNMHATMLDTWPPIMYLNDVSKEIIYAIHDYNTSAGEIKAGYTFDAGPNAHIFTIEKYVPEIKKILEEIEGVQKIMVCKIGNGPKILTAERDHLIDENGNVKKHFFDETSGKLIVE
ncbi:MAG: diphosphomevalonate decarboxylase [Candidatus Micrarchaeia archaeon]